MIGKKLKRRLGDLERHVESSTSPILPYGLEQAYKESAEQFQQSQGVINKQFSPIIISNQCTPPIEGNLTHAQYSSKCNESATDDALTQSANFLPVSAN